MSKDLVNIAQKMKISIKDFFSKCDQTCRKTRDFVTFSEEVLNGKLLFLCSGSIYFDTSDT